MAVDNDRDVDNVDIDDDDRYEMTVVDDDDDDDALVLPAEFDEDDVDVVVLVVVLEMAATEPHRFLPVHLATATVLSTPLCTRMALPGKFTAMLANSSCASSVSLSVSSFSSFFFFFFLASPSCSSSVRLHDARGADMLVLVAIGLSTTAFDLLRPLVMRADCVLPLAGADAWPPAPVAVETACP